MHNLRFLPGELSSQQEQLIILAGQKTGIEICIEEKGLYICNLSDPQFARLVEATQSKWGIPFHGITIKEEKPALSAERKTQWQQKS